MLPLMRLELKGFLRVRAALFWTFAFPLLLLTVQMALFGHGYHLPPVTVHIDAAPDPGVAAYRDAIGRALAVNDQPKVTLAASGDVTITIAPGQVRVTAAHRTESTAALLGELQAMTADFNASATGVPPAFTLHDKMPPPDSGNHYALYLLSGLAVMVALSSSLMGFTLPLVQARDQGLLKLYALYPVTPGAALAGIALSRFVIVIGAVVLLTVAGLVMYDVPITGNWVQIARAAGFLGLGTASFLCLGLAIAALSRTMQTAGALANLIYFLLLFSGDLMMPVSGLGKVAQTALSAMPVNQLVATIRRGLGGQALCTDDLIALVTLGALGMLAFVTARAKFRWQA